MPDGPSFPVAVPFTALWTLQEGDGPILAAALHHGHDLRPQVATRLAVSEADRLREEDPFTGRWTEVAPNRLIVHRSRFEVDMNRARDKAVYRRPEDAWRLSVWQGEPPGEIIEDSLAQYDAFYDELRRFLSNLQKIHGHFVVLDLHSYNHHRQEPAAGFDDPVKNPEVDVETSNMDLLRWRPIVDRFKQDLLAFDFLGRRLDVRENVRFKGGHFSRWIHDHFPFTGCAISVEVKKFFMDEWTGQADRQQLTAIGQALQSTIPGLREEIEKHG